MSRLQNCRPPSFPSKRALSCAVIAVAAAAAPVDVLKQFARLVASDGEDGDLFGHAVAVESGVSLVGVPGDGDNGPYSGSAYLFDNVTGGQVRKLVPTDGEARDLFGFSVALSGSTIVVGASSNDASGVDSGSAYVFDLVTGDQLLKLLPDPGTTRAAFGGSVAVSGTLAVVGAAYDNVNGARSGSAYLFDVTTGLKLAKLLPRDGAAGDSFGYSVAIDGAFVLVGAPGNFGSVSASGAVYVFDPITGLEIDKLVASDGRFMDGFWSAVSVSGSLAIVSSPRADDQGGDAGAAYLFDMGTRHELAKLLPIEFGGVGAHFGAAVSIHGETAVVGARYQWGSGSGSGAAYLFDARTGRHISRLLPDIGTMSESFGASVAIHGRTVLVGAPFLSPLVPNTEPEPGNAYLFGASRPSVTRGR